jgi:type IV pilus assembly protein PilA
MPSREAARRQRDDQGFTLIEILVVLIIIGILAAIATPVFLSQRTKGYEASEKSDLRAVAGKVEIFYTDNFTYLGVPFGAGSGAGNAVAGSGQVVGPGEAVTVSKGNTITLSVVGAKGYCLSAANPSAAQAWYYDSSGGGITTTSCTSKSYS